ncbi:molybdenum cofactor guanylyltransferase [Pedobacter aquae]|uniref:Molybdenum cofactor guanylyltransferase n=1 Tax=Pedobacter aquae TaxID=2605747 RepID=A0A5C0VMR5_9SPHI|nr:molybdenum cofactor guanylyltransferase [Pedobacter aquae]QEK52911.1 molybdenum cofactor guanylyltransferase [Pedobacter aquae]
MTSLSGLILCGGQSKRMGTDKGLILNDSLKDKQPWFTFMADKLKPFALKTFISINKTQLEPYQKYFNPASFIIDQHEVEGPLNGLLSAHQLHPETDFIVLACDLINLQTATLTKLIESYQQFPDYDYYAYHNQQFWEPLCAIYTAKALKNYPYQASSKHSFQALLNQGKTYKLDIQQPESFINHNQPL